MLAEVVSGCFTWFLLISPVLSPTCNPCRVQYMGDMPKLSNKSFTDLLLKKLKPGPARRDYFDAATRGLGIRVSPSGTKTWFVMRRVRGRMSRYTLGRYPEMSLATARMAAIESLGSMQEGNA